MIDRQRGSDDAPPTSVPGATSPHRRPTPAVHSEPLGWPTPHPSIQQQHEPHGVPVTIHTGAGIRTRWSRLPQVLEAGVLPVDTLLSENARTVLFVPQGPVRLRFASQYWFARVGRAQVDIDGRSGPQDVHYTAPHTIWSHGVAGLGARSPRRPGGSFLVWLVLGTVVVLVATAVLFTLSQG